MAEEKQEKKIIVDDDWKAQAQAEKQRLAAKTEKKAEGAGEARRSPGEGGGQPRQIPPASFATLVNSLVTQVLFALGGFEDPQTKKRYVDLDLAKHHIDTLSMLEEKTRGNLSDAEKKLLDQALYEARMSYVQVAQSASRVG